MSRSKVLTKTYPLSVRTADENEYVFPTATRWYLANDFLNIEFLDEDMEQHYMSIAASIIDHYTSVGAPITN